MRLKIPDGRIVSAQLRLIAKLLPESAPFADLTTRLEIDLPVSGDEAAAKLAEAGIQTAQPGPGAPLTLEAESLPDRSGVHEQQPGSFSIGVPVVAGRLTAEQVKKLADLIERNSDGSLRLTANQNIQLSNVPQEKVAPMLEGLASAGLNVNAPAIARELLVLTGAGCCRTAPQARQRARELADHLCRITLDEPLLIDLLCCAEAGISPRTAQVVLRGAPAEVDGQIVEAFDASVGGRTVARGIPPADLKDRLERLLLAFKRQRKAGERFADFCMRLGDEAVAKLLTEVPQLAS